MPDPVLAPPTATDPHRIGVFLGRCGGSARKSARAAAAVLAVSLDDGELVEALCVGKVLGASAVAVLTDRRVVMVNDQEWHPAVHILPVDATLQVQGWQDDRTASLTFVQGDRQLTIESIGDRPLAHEMAAKVRGRTGV